MNNLFVETNKDTSYRIYRIDDAGEKHFLMEGEGDSKNVKQNQYRRVFKASDNTAIEDIELAELAEQIASEKDISYKDALSLASKRLE
jgi:transposase